MYQTPARNNNDHEQISVAIIGGGISGLSCASHILLNHPELKPTVFDTGRVRAGGRCSSRLPGDIAKDKKQSRDSVLNNYVVDHTAQILTVPETSKGKKDKFLAFREQVRGWERKGVVRKFPAGSVCEIVPNRRKDAKEKMIIRSINNNKDMYHGTRGMQSIPEDILSSVPLKVHQDVWISPSNGVKYQSGTGKWDVRTNNKSLGSYDRLVIAHNGKCADRLMSKTPAKALHSLLRTNFSPNVPASGGERMTLNSIYSLTFAIKKEDGSKGVTNPLRRALGKKVISAFVKNEPNLRFITCQSLKYPNPRYDDKYEVYTLLASPKFSKKYKGPQENLPPKMMEEVTKVMMRSLELSLKIPEGALQTVETRVQLWGAAVPINTWVSPSRDTSSKSGAAAKPEDTSGFLYDAQFGVGVCGDWLMDPSIGGAWESGRRLAEFISENHQLKDEAFDESRSVGLPPNGSFAVSKAAEGAGIGNV